MQQDSLGFVRVQFDFSFVKVFNARLETIVESFVLENLSFVTTMNFLFITNDLMIFVDMLVRVVQICMKEIVCLFFIRHSIHSNVRSTFRNFS